MLARDTEALLSQGKEMLDWSEEEVLQVLGFQLLATEKPKKPAAIAKYLASTAYLGEAKKIVGDFPSEELLPVSMAGLGAIVKEAAERGRRFIQESTSELRSALCTGTGECRPEIVELLDRGEDVLSKITDLVSDKLQIPPFMSSMAITVTVLLIKGGLNQFCK
jgi:hypothetical protein